MRTSFVIAACLGLWGLGCGRPAIEHSTRIAYGPLKDVILLPLTTRSWEGVLGHVLREDGVTPDRSRSIFRGTPRFSETVQKVTVVRELSADAHVSAEYGPLKAEVSEGTVTHLAYVVEVTGYAEISPQGEYVSESDCCFNGEADPACEQGFVLRLVRGNGVVKYLQKAESTGKLGAADYFETRLGERFRVVDESSFQDAFFAFEPGDMFRLCSTLPDDASFAAIQVTPKPNCSVMAYDIRGDNRHLARFLPDEQTCHVIARTFCGEKPNTVRCVGSFAMNPAFSIELDAHGTGTAVAAEPRTGEPSMTEQPAAAVGAAAGAAVDAAPSQARTTAADAPAPE